MNEFIEKIYEIAFGDDAINKGYSQDDVVNQLYAQSQELINYIKRNETVVFTECENPKTQQVNVSLTLEASTTIDKDTLRAFIKKSMQAHKQGISVVAMDIKEEAEIYALNTIENQKCKGDK